jgi:hypothetical protein
MARTNNGNAISLRIGETIHSPFMELQVVHPDLQSFLQSKPHFPFSHTKRNECYILSDYYS